MVAPYHWSTEIAWSKYRRFYSVPSEQGSINVAFNAEGAAGTPAVALGAEGPVKY